MKKYIIALILIITLLIPSVALASDISNSIYFGQVRVTNNGTATSNVGGVFSNNSTAWISAGFMNATATDIAIRGSGGEDRAFMPGYDDGVWSVFIDDAPAGNKDLTLFTNSTGGKIRYFPGTGGMTTPDSPGLKLGDEFTYTASGWLNTDNGTDKIIVEKERAFSVFNSPIVSGNITAYIHDVSTLIMLPDGVGSNTTLTIVQPGATPHWSVVDETPAAPDDADYVGVTGVPNTKEDSYHTASPSYAGAPITVDNVTAHFRYLSMVGATHSHYQPLLYFSSSGEKTYGTNIDSTADTGAIKAVSEVLARPGGGSWTIADLEELEVGIKIYSNGTTPKCYQLSLEVAYTYAQAEVTVTGVTSGNHTVEVARDNPFWKIGVDATDEEMSLPTTSGLILNLPLWQPESYAAPGGDFTSIDATGFTCNVTGATWTTDGYLFDGVNDLLSLGNIGNLTDYTVTAWVYWYDASNYENVFQLKYEAGVQKTNLTTRDTKTSEFFGRGTGGTSVTLPAGTFADNEWIMVTCSQNATEIENRVDGGRLSNELITSSNTTAFSTNLVIGTGYDGSALRSGHIIVGEFRVYDRKITDEEDEDNYNATKARYTSGDVYNYSAGGTVPNNSENWTFLSYPDAASPVMAYMEYQEITINGTQQQYIEWEYTTGDFTDQSGKGHHATPSFRTASSDADVTIALISFGPLEKAEVDADIAITWPGFGVTQGAPDAPGTTYSENATPGIFFAPLVHAIWNGTGAGGFIPVAVFWYWFAFFGILFGGMVTYWAFAEKRQQALLIKIIVMLAIMTFWALPGPNIYGLYVVVYFALWSFGALVLSKSFGW